MSRRFIFQVEFLDYRGVPPEGVDTSDPDFYKRAVGAIMYRFRQNCGGVIPNASQIKVTYCSDHEDKA